MRYWSQTGRMSKSSICMAHIRGNAKGSRWLNTANIGIKWAFITFSHIRKIDKPRIIYALYEYAESRGKSQRLVLILFAENESDDSK